MNHFPENVNAKTNRAQILNVQKSPSDKSGLGSVESISVSAPYSTNFVPSSSSKPFVSEIVVLGYNQVCN